MPPNHPASTGIRLRKATVADAAKLSVVARDLFAQTFAAQNTETDLRAYLDEAFSPELQRAELAAADTVVWLAEASTGEAVGYALLRNNSSVEGITALRPAEIQRIYADTALHGQGLGARLMAACLEQASSWNCDLIWLAVWEGNPRAIAFYEKVGFTRVGIKTFQLGSDLQHDFVMARNLSI